MATGLNASSMNQSTRIEQHRANFEALKGEFLSLQRSHEELKEEYADLSRNYVSMTEKSEEVIKRIQDERDLKIMECEQLKSEMLSPSQMVDLKETIAVEFEELYRKQLKSLEIELQVLRSEHKKISKNYEFLQSEHASVQMEYEDKLKENKGRLQKEIEHYKERCRELAVRLEKDIPSELQKIRQLQKEKAELCERNRGLLTENEQLRARLDSRDITKDQEAFALNHQLTELKATLDQASNDNLSLQTRNKHLLNELESQVHETQSLSKQLIEQQREVKIWKRKHEDYIHENARQNDALKRKNVEQLQQYIEERKRLNEELEQQRIESETRELSMKQLEAAIEEKDKELSVAVEKAIETEWQRRVEVEKQKVALEGKLSKLQREALIIAKEQDRTVNELKEQIQTLTTDKLSMETELHSVQQELQQKNLICSQSSKELSDLKELRNKISILTQDKSRLEESERQLEEDNESLMSKNQILTQQIQSMQSEIDQIGMAHQNDINVFRKEQEEERITWKNRLDELSNQKKKCEEKLNSVKKKRAKLQREHDRSIREVERLLEVAHENEKLTILEKDKIRKSADEDIKSLKQQLKSVKKQHQQFLTLMTSSPHNVLLKDFKAREIDSDIISIGATDGNIG